MKPGYKTTEFWLTLLAQIVPLLVLAGIVPREDVKTVLDSTTGIITGTSVVVTNALVLASYISRRLGLKDMEMQLAIRRPPTERQ